MCVYKIRQENLHALEVERPFGSSTGKSQIFRQNSPIFLADLHALWGLIYIYIYTDICVYTKFDRKAMNLKSLKRRE